MRRATRTVVLAAVAAGLTLLPAAMTSSLSGSALAATVTANGTKSNTYKTAADCTKAGGTWGTGREGLGCYLPLPAQPASTVNTSKSNTYKVAGVDAKANTFTATDKAGKAFTFAAPKGGTLPTVGKIYDVTYTESPGGGPLQAKTVNTSKSNNF